MTTPAPECPICGHRVYRSHECKGTRARSPWRRRPDDFDDRVQRARNASQQLDLDLVDELPELDDDA